MRYRVVCVSRAIGAGGEAIGQVVGERLGFRYFDDEVISLASEMAGIHPAVVAGAEHHKSLLARLLDVLLGAPPESARVHPLRTGGAYYSAERRPSLARPQEEKIRRLIQEAIVEIAGWGNAVIVAHAASLALADRQDVLRVLVTASERTRCERLSLDSKLSNEVEAKRAVAESDLERARYLERFFGICEEHPTLYDLVVNTDALGLEQAVDAIVAVARA